MIIHERGFLCNIFLLLVIAAAIANASHIPHSTENENIVHEEPQQQHDVFSLRASHLYHHQQPQQQQQEHSPPLIEDRSLIIDKDALEDLAHDGADPTAEEFIFHPPGHEANVNDYAFFAHWSHAMCGATVIHDDILLSGGHCGRKATEPHWRKTVRLLSKYRESQHR